MQMITKENFIMVDEANEGGIEIRKVNLCIENRVCVSRMNQHFMNKPYQLWPPNIVRFY